MKWKYLISKILTLVCLITGQVAAEETPKQVQKQGEDCLRLLLEGNSGAISHYDEKAGIFIGDTFISEKASFVPVLEEMLKKHNIKGTKSLFYLIHNEVKGMEVGYFLDAANKETILYATGWSQQDDTWKKDFEFIRPLEQSPNYHDEFLASRKRWVNLCNEQGPVALTSEMYLDDALYFSYGELTTGAKDIAERYSYMSNPDYTLDLRGEFTISFNESDGMEVGNYINARNEGVYIIIWKKVDDAWKIILDFNF